MDYKENAECADNQKAWTGSAQAGTSAPNSVMIDPLFLVGDKVRWMDNYGNRCFGVVTGVQEFVRTLLVVNFVTGQLAYVPFYKVTVAHGSVAFVTTLEGAF